VIGANALRDLALEVFEPTNIDANSIISHHQVTDQTPDRWNSQAHCTDINTTPDKREAI
jgi:hypothetical protein